MTKRREPLTYHRTLTTIAAHIGWDRCAAICGVTERMVRYWSDPDCETEIRLIDAERLDRAFIDLGGDHAPFLRLFTMRLDLAASAASGADLVAASACAAKESGEAVAALIGAAQAHDPVLRRRARKEAEEAIASLTAALAALDGQDGDKG